MSYARASRPALSAAQFADPANWRQEGNDWLCLVCNGTVPQKLANALSHERTGKHQHAVTRARSSATKSPSAGSAQAPGPSNAAQAPLPTLPNHPLFSDIPAHFDGSRDFLSFLGARLDALAPPRQSERQDGSSVPQQDEFMQSEQEEIPVYVSSLEQLATERLERDMLRRAHREDPDVEIASDDDAGELPASEIESSSDEEVVVVDGVQAGRRNMKRRAEGADDNAENPWFPWANQQECALDVLMHLRRSALSRNQITLLIWFAMFNGAQNMPSERQMRDSDALLQRLCGIRTADYIGAMGNRFSMNSLADMIAQEYANPRVRSHLHDLPEDAGPHLQEAWQSTHWKTELPLNLATPMIRVGTLDFYVFEPALLSASVGNSVCMPFRWLERRGRRFAQAWRMVPAVRENANGTSSEGWYIHEYETIEVPESQLSLPLPLLLLQHSRYNLPSPSAILGSFTSRDHCTSGSTTTWTRTDPSVGNRWRTLASGSRVRAVPCWLYADDTSGNMSKKWNEHNSFLFTLAGLPREQAQLEYNIHFLTTSNTAEVTEMMDAAISQFEECQETGIWAYDVVDEDLVLLIPSVFAMLGDNPMQSEFCCHIGLRGRFFCRSCWVKGKGGEADGDGDEGNRNPERSRQTARNEDGQVSDTASIASMASQASEASGQAQQSVHSDAQPASSSGRPKGGKKSKPLESMSEMLDRVRAFIKTGRPRTKGETEANLADIRSAAYQDVNAQKDFKTMKTKSGLKDTFFEFFADKLFAAVKNKRGSNDRREAASRARAAFPPEVSSPIWRLTELDPHRDTPVEILHVVLLGIVKYFWRDVVNNQCSTPQSRAELIARLNSFDVSGLGIAPLRGETLVQYAGSLVGRDFRAVVQAAPFVLHGIVDEKCYRAWTYLANLVPQIWQPQIDDVETYMNRLTQSINDFMSATARWSPDWFNKPKFHILLHLPEHVRRFGPAILFATEGFESFNAVIRIKSLHSNRQAPSRDIARAMAQSDRVRHLLSGGFFFRRPPVGAGTPTPVIDLSTPRHTRVRAYCGEKPDGTLSVARAGNGAVAMPMLFPIVHKYLGLPSETAVVTGAPTYSAGAASVPFSETLSGAQRLSGPLPTAMTRRCARIHIKNGDVVATGSWVLFRSAGANGGTHVGLGRVAEILDLQPSSISPAFGLLLHCAQAPATLDRTYHMPLISSRTTWRLIPLQDTVCTVNVQHNCAAHNCTVTGSRVRMQERRATSQAIPIIAHNSADDWILNTGQMRDARHLRFFAIFPDPQDMENALLTGITQLIQRRKDAHQHANQAGALSSTATSNPTNTQQTALLQRVTNPARGARVARGTSSQRPAAARTSASSSAVETAHRATQQTSVAPDVGGNHTNLARLPFLVPSNAPVPPPGGRPRGSS